MIAITTRSSTRVKPPRTARVVFVMEVVSGTTDEGTMDG